MRAIRVAFFLLSLSLLVATSGPQPAQSEPARDEATGPPSTEITNDVALAGVHSGWCSGRGRYTLQANALARLALNGWFTQ